VLNVSTNWRDEAKALEQRLMIMQDHYAELARALGSPAGGFWGDPIETHAEILRRVEQLAEQLAELDAFVAVHQYILDANPTDLWPKDSVLAKAIARHEARELARRSA
jgi:hypothetical protein